MSSINSIALSGMNAAQAQLDASASNIANLSTKGFKRQEVSLSEQAGGGVSAAPTKAEVDGAALEADFVAQMQAKNTFLANLDVFKTSDKMAGTILDTSA